MINFLLRFEDDNTCGAKLRKKQDDDTRAPIEIPETIFGKIAWFISLPINIVFLVTIPDVRRPACRQLFCITFIVSIIWIGLLTYVLIWMVTVIGYTAGIPDTVMGLTLVAFGSSVPDCLSSLFVARKGKPDCLSIFPSNCKDTVSLHVHFHSDKNIMKCRTE